jgi:hypothetical protein
MEVETTIVERAQLFPRARVRAVGKGQERENSLSTSKLIIFTRKTSAMALREFEQLCDEEEQS